MITVHHPEPTTIGPRRFAWGERTYLMGVINVSPESFWNGKYDEPEAALRRGLELVEQGADILDVGGQSTRPMTVPGQQSRAGFIELDPQEEIERVAPGIERLAGEVDAVISIDTYKVPVAREALKAGAHLINDIEGFRHDPAMASLAVEYGAAAVVMHNQRDREFHDVIGDIRAGIEESLDIAIEVGLDRERLIVDPGFGFGWTPEQNIEMLRRLGELRDLNLPVLVATSRKSTIGKVLGDAPPEERLHGTSASIAIAIANGADIVRVHDVAEMRDVARVADAIARGWPRAQ